MGRIKASMAEIEEKMNQFKPQELNEGNVQAIFNRCLATNKSEKMIPIVLFSKVFGYQEDDEILIQFDSALLTANKRNIEYLFGQLQYVHKNCGQQDETRKGISYEEFSTSYNGSKWTDDRGALLKFLYLGCNPETSLIKPFNKKYNGTDIRTNIKPTLSPKDPNFPAWWEAHKSEWED